MREHSLQNRYTTGRSTLPVVYIICAIGWIIGLIYLPASFYPYATENPIWNMIDFSYFPAWMNQMGSLGILTLVGYLLIQLNNQFTIITVRATVQSTIFLLFITTIPQIHILQPAVVGTLLYIGCTFFIFMSYKEYDSMVQQYFAYLIFALLFLLMPKFIVFLPLFTVSKIAFNCFNLRTIFASILGFLTPIWFLLAHAIWHDQMNLFYYPFLNLLNWQGLFDYAGLKWSMIALWSFCSILTLLTIFSQTILRSGMRTRTRQMLNHFSRMAFAFMAFTAIYPKFLLGLTPIWFLCVSFTYGYYLVTQRTKISNYVFLAVLTLLFSLFVYNLWTL